MNDLSGIDRLSARGGRASVADRVLNAFDLHRHIAVSGDIPVGSPIDGSILGGLKAARPAEIQTAIAAASDAFPQWRDTPAPVRGELVRLLGEELRAHKEELGALVSLEAGKVTSEGLGEVQEMIDICDFAVGLSRQLHGLTIASERPGHHMTETWHPLGPVGVISAFNFPVAVWSWNTALALVCGDPVIWKPSEKTPLCGLACQYLFERAAARFGAAPKGLHQILIGGREVGEALADSPAIKLVSATGSTRMGRVLGPRVAARFGRTILELGGNNAVIVAPSADLELAIRGILFGAAGTAGQRCTTTRRLFVHDSVYDALVPRLKSAYAAITIGDPMQAGVLVGPLIDEAARDGMVATLDKARASGAVVSGGERVELLELAGGFYMRPALVEHPADVTNVMEETFAPILHVFRYTDFEDAVRRNNDVPQGLSSAIFTTDLREAGRFISAAGSDCGIANVNLGTSGAEIGGAFGGEKETGGGRESGSDSWKAYMRRQTHTMNYSSELPLAQGVDFPI
ncbi:MAG: aldehyde dehydrogenase family protein [Brevundimonas sp.]|uniref:L-piperidine-6-carboxylate dehydrogenase n=1 Tax=Brevundimonas sp. TaxID=1871086 RepID=UPI00121F12C6|nr:aldehyde dehydrogenase family protein [Brevundimonas sp.]RZJ19685.1 MAG: aldehyde dehydrogenase family protein [Brevundimonas sp.]